VLSEVEILQHSAAAIERCAARACLSSHLRSTPPSLGSSSVLTAAACRRLFSDKRRAKLVRPNTHLLKPTSLHLQPWKPPPPNSAPALPELQLGTAALGGRAHAAAEQLSGAAPPVSLLRRSILTGEPFADLQAR